MTRLRLVSLVVLLMAAAQASAQDTHDEQSLTIPTMAFAAAAIGDWTSTYYGISHQKFSEGDPLINRLQSRPALMITAGAAIDVGGALIWNRYFRPRHPKLAIAGLYVAAGFRAYLCAKGFTLIERTGNIRQ